ncbi:MAG: hypothetical protein GXP31_03405 [Kiritimatiellaeota bacterium]|nr:hypothetical protein [Kiritimatiellota bacterium]
MNRSSYRFAVFFDTHYCLERTLELVPGCAETSDIPRYQWMARCLFPRMLEELRTHRPHLCVCTGDICEGGAHASPGVLERELREVIGHFEQAGLPMVNARGTHEPGGVYAAAALPAFSRALGRKLERNWFHFDTPAGRFAVIEYLTLAPGNEQATWLEDACLSIPADTPLFLAAHAPIANFARPLFSHRPMQTVLASLFARRRPTIFFCGHTHNQALSWHRVGDGGFAQVKGSSVGFPGVRPEPLSTRHVLLLEEADTCFFGVPEDQAPGYWIFDAEPGRLVGSWYGTGRGRLARVHFALDGKSPPEILEAPVFGSPELLAADLPLVRTATLEMFTYGLENDDLACRLNGVPLGRLPAGGGFAARRFLPLPKAAVRTLSTRNELWLGSPTTSAMFAGGARIAAITYDGRTLASRIPPVLFAAGRFVEALRAACPARSERIQPVDPRGFSMELPLA